VDWFDLSWHKDNWQTFANRIISYLLKFHYVQLVILHDSICYMFHVRTHNEILPSRAIHIYMAGECTK